MLFAVFSLARAGAGFLNGDAAVYAWQGQNGHWQERSTHLLWNAWSCLVGGRPLWLDLTHVVCGVFAVHAVGRVAEHRALGMSYAALMLLPWAPYAEVDLPWVAAIAAAVMVGSTLSSSVLVVLAVGLSPTALLAVPWLAVRRRSMAPVVAAVLAVLGVMAVSRGEWWWGERGVWNATLHPGQTIENWAWMLLLTAPAWFGNRLPRWETVACLPLLLAPSDVPAWWVWGVAVAMVSVPSPRNMGVRLAWLAAVSLGTGFGVHGGVIRDEIRVARAVESVELGDSLMGSWSLAVRVSLRETGDPKGLTRLSPQDWNHRGCPSGRTWDLAKERWLECP